MSQQELNEIAVTLEECEKMTKIGEALNRLYENPDFKLIVLEQYFKEEPARCVVSLGRLQHDEKATQRIHRDLSAIGNFQVFLQTIRQAHNEALRAMSQLPELQATIEKEMAEEQA